MSYYTEVSNSNPQIWWRMNVSGTGVINSSTDPTYSTVSATIVGNGANTISVGTAVYTNGNYYPANSDQTCSLFQNYYWGNPNYCSSSAQSILTGVFDLFVTGGQGFTAEWLHRHTPGGTYSN